jgi:hypothetical protein
MFTPRMPGSIATLAFLLVVASWGAPRVASASLDGTWSALDSSVPAPVARREYAAILDVQRHRYIVFAGLGYTDPGPIFDFKEVWALSLGPDPTWTEIALADGPGERHSPQWGYDPARQRLLVFGGYGHHYPGGENEYLNDVWELSLDGDPEWHEIFPSGTAPDGRLAGAAVYDPLRQRFVGFGGTRGLPVDTWSLDLSGEPAWSTVDTDSTGPPGSYGMTTVYDILRDRMLLFGGSTSDDYWGVHNDVWALSLLTATPSWSRLAPSGAPPSARRSGTAILDPLRDRMIVYGGWDSQSNETSSFLGDTWALSLSPEPHWTPLDPGGPIPTGRDAMAAIYDPLGDRMVVFGGWSGNLMLNDTWFLGWGGLPQAPAMSGTSVALPEMTRTSWGVQNVGGLRAAVYRREPGTEWSSVATIVNDGSGTLRYDDHAVTRGARYGYQLVVASQLGATFGGEVWVDVPAGTVGIGPGAGAALALHPPRPNPVVGRFRVSFALPGGEGARIDVVDVAGRRIVSREVGAMGPGAHEIDLGPAREYPSGLYFVRLTHAGRSLVTRAIIGGAAR